MSILTENWHTWYILEVLIANPELYFQISDPKIRFRANFGRKNSSCLFLLKIGMHGIFLMPILILTLAFWIYLHKSIFGEIWGKKSQNCSFCLKNCTHVIPSFLIFVPSLVSWISKPKSIFGQIWTEKLKAVQVGWKLAHGLSRRCWFLFSHYFSLFPKLIPFSDKFGPKNSVVHFDENWHTWYIEQADCYSGNSFLNCQP